MLLPHHGELVLPEWNGNEFLHADGSRPHLRTLTPLRIDPERGEVDVDIVLHGAGPMATWAAAATVGDPVAISGTGRGYAIDAGAPLLLAGDESACPPSRPSSTRSRAMPVRVIVEVGHPDAELELQGPGGLTVSWHVLAGGLPPGDALVAAVVATPIAAGTRTCGWPARRRRCSGSVATSSRRWTCRVAVHRARLLEARPGGRRRPDR